jgi:hypothetical protein
LGILNLFTGGLSGESPHDMLLQPQELFFTQYLTGKNRIDSLHPENPISASYGNFEFY